MKRFLLLVLAVVLAPSFAQSAYPDRPVKLIIDSAAGSATDVINRILAEQLGAMWGQQVLTINRPGAAGAIAAREASQAIPDGSTLYIANASVFTALKRGAGVAPNLPVEVPRDFIPIGFTVLQPMFIAVSSQSGINSLHDLIEAAKKQPGALSYATTGVGRITHLTMELPQDRAGIKLQMVPYTGGPTAAMADVATGRVAIVTEAYAGLAGGFQSKSIKPIAVTSYERLPEFPDLATVAETFPGFIAGGWNVLLAPLGTPDSIVNGASADLMKVVGQAQVRDGLAKLGAYVHPMTPSEVETFIKEQQTTWRPIVEKVSSKSE